MTPRERKALKKKRWNRENPQKVEAQRLKFRQRDDIRSYDRNNNLKAKYGITSEVYDALLRSQGGHCGFPGCTATEAFPGGKSRRRLIVDHDHKTGKLRKLLCSRHNVLLGFARESVEELMSAILYIQSFSGQDVTKERTNGVPDHR